MAATATTGLKALGALYFFWMLFQGISEGIRVLVRVSAEEQLRMWEHLLGLGFSILQKQAGRDFDALLLQYCQERFLYTFLISPFGFSIFDFTFLREFRPTICD